MIKIKPKRKEKPWADKEIIIGDEKRKRNEFNWFNEKTKNKKRTIQEEIEADYYRLFMKIDKIFEKEFGKMCPEFEPNCFQCKAHLIYNNFKKDLYDTFVK